MIIKISNGSLFAEIDTRGAELQRIYNSTDVDFLWNGDSRFWSRRAPVLFPICGGMKDDSYTLDGVQYSMPKHGFCRDAEFTVDYHTENEAVFYIESNEERIIYFPFRFRFSIKYSITDGALHISYIVDNLDNKTMYFSVGSHEAYACPEGIEGYHIEFEKEEQLESLVIENNLIQPHTVLVSEKSSLLPLKYDYFAVDALCFRNIRSKNVWLVGNGRRIEVSWDDFEFVLFWTKPNAPFICIELNCGTDDFVGTDGNIKTKEGIISLEPQKQFMRTHSMRFFKE